MAARETIARRLLGIGGVRLSRTHPAGKRGTVTPRRIYLIDDSPACLAGNDLGEPTRLEEGTASGRAWLSPAGPTLGIGQARKAAEDAAAY